MADQFILTEASAKVLQRLLDDYKRMRRNTLGSTQEEELPTTPEVYVARTPGSGIAALRRDTDTGTGVLPIGTGTPPGQGHTPGSADCQIFRTFYTSTTPNLMPMGFTRKVLNLSTTAIPGNEWILVSRDKYGDWYVGDKKEVTTSSISASVTVEGYGGVPSYPETSTIRFYGNQEPAHVAPFTINTFAANKVEVILHAASDTESGYVDVGEQFFAGQKTILGTGSLSVNLAHGDATTGLAGHRAGKALYGANTYSYTTYLADGSTVKTGASHLQINTSATWVEYSIAYNANFNDATFRIGMHAESHSLPSATQTCYFFTYDNLNEQRVNGVSGTVALGATVIGGIVVSLGSGTPGPGSVTSISAGTGITCTPDPITTTGTVAAKYQMSITADGSGLKLSGDSGSPGNNKLYGTNGSGTKGWYGIPGGGAGITGSITYVSDATCDGTTWTVTKRTLTVVDGIITADT